MDFADWAEGFRFLSHAVSSVPLAGNLTLGIECPRLTIRPVTCLFLWEQAIGFQFTKDAAQSLLHAIYGVEETPAIHLEFLATYLPVRAEKEVIPKNTMLGLGQSPFADETEVGRKLFVFVAPCASAVFTRQRVKRHLTHESLPAHAVAKMLKACAEDSSQHTVAWVGRIAMTHPQPQTEANIAPGSC
jgi:hypothetical protein